MFTVIIPLFNKLEFIEKTVYSILAQTCSDFEIIVVDDGSTDGSAELVKNIADKRIRLIHQKNSGVSAARNRGIKEANHNMIAFLDADDWWDKEYLSNMSMLISKYPDHYIFSTRYARVIDNVEIPSKQFFNENNCYVSFNLLETVKDSKAIELPLHTSCVIIDKQILKMSGDFDERISFFEDYDLFVRISLYSNVAYLIGKPLTFYSQDIPREKRATGKLPNLSNHWVYYFDKYEPFVRNNELLKQYLDKATLNALLKYRNISEYKNEIKLLKKKVSYKNYSWKYFIIYHTPKMFTKIFIDANKIFNYLVNAFIVKNR